MSRRDSIESRMGRLVVMVCVFMAAILAVVLALVLAYNSQYKNLLYNVTTASEFNQDFKENIDLKMYYYVIESRYSEGLPIQEIQDAQALAKDLLNSTSQKDSLQAVTSVLDLSRRAEDVIGGDLTVREPVRSETYEIRTLSEGMEQMIARLNAQIQEITQKQASLRKTELALLQAQINPHFLYNTMDTIIWLIEADRPQAAVEMVSNLSSFFRHSLSRGEDVITLGEEEEHVRSYLQIQQARYKDILDYAVEIDPALRETRLPKLTLQPLVENALYHGIKRKRGKGHISVTSGREGDSVLILLAAYTLRKSEGESLEDYLQNRVFAGASGSTVQPDPALVQGFNTYIQRYQALLKVEQTAVEHL